MAYSKIILNGETLMDVTGDTVDAGNLLSGKTATKNSGAKVTGNIASKSSSDLTVSGATVTAPAGYYSAAASKAVATTTHPNPTAAIASATGVVTATHTQGTGYVTGGTTTGTLNLTTQAAQTINTSTADQTIASNRWLTGAQTIKSVTTSNLTAANIKSGTVVKVGDANNASRITQVTGTLKEGTPHTAKISGTGNSSNCYVQYNGNKYYTNGNTFTFYEGDTITFYVKGTGTPYIAIGNGEYAKGTSGGAATYSYTALGFNLNIQIEYSSTNPYIWILTYDNDLTDEVKELRLGEGSVFPSEQEQSIFPSTSYYGLRNVWVAPISSTYVGTGVARKSSADLTASGSTVTVPVGYYSSQVTKNVASTTHPNPTAAFESTFGVFTATHAQDAGYVAAGTTTSTYNLTRQAAQTIYTSTADQTIASYRWLTGTQTIKSVTTSNLTAENIKNGVTVRVGDTNSKGRITDITGTYNPLPSYTATLMNSGFYDSRAGAYDMVKYNETNYYSSGNTFQFYPGDNLSCIMQPWNKTTLNVNVNGSIVLSSYSTYSVYNYTLPNYDINITFQSVGTLVGMSISGPITLITSNGIYDVTDYGMADVNVAGGEYYGLIKAIAQRNTIFASGSTARSYTAEDVSNYFNTVTLTSGKFCTLDWNGNFTFNDASCVGEQCFASAASWTYTVQSGSRYTFNFPNANSIGKGAFYGTSHLSAITAPKCSFVDAHAFAFCNLTSIALPSCTTLSYAVFESCKYLSYVSLSSFVSLISSYAFSGCSSLQTINFSDCSAFAAGAFYGCNVLTTPISFPNCSRIGTSAFYACWSISNVNLPSCTEVSSWAFAYTGVINVSLPICSRLGENAFNNCTSLLSITLPSITGLVSYAFRSCYNLSIVSLPKCSTIYGSAFQYCYNLLKLDLTGVSSVPTLYKTAFSSTPIAGYTTSTGGVYGSIYVPSSLYDSFISATSWSTYSARMVSV